tara:strand:- start:902 stop:1369 length:468 start_codon:yes stop_codon:yes gene_type:complete
MNSLIANRFIHFTARIARKVPILVKIATFLGIKKPELQFSSSDQYWQERYEQGGNSGEGSYGALSIYKAEFINGLVAEKKISSVIEFGCGDGNQTSLFTFPNYTGVDISSKCIENCRSLLGKSGYEFVLLNDYLGQKESGRFDLSISLDVICRFR